MPHLLPAEWNARAAANQVMAGLVNICEPHVKGAHDADFIIVDGKAYIVYMANDVQPGEAAAWSFVYNALSVVDVETLAVAQTTVFAATEKEYENETLPVGACFVPRIIRKDDTTLRCFFSSEEPGKRQSQTWHIDYDLSTRTFDWNIYPVEIETDQGVFPMQPQYLHQDAAAKGFAADPVDFGLYMIDGFKYFDGKVYAVLNNFPGGQNAWAGLNEAMDRVTVLGHYFKPNEAKLTEAAVNRLPNGTWMSISRQGNRDRRYMFSQSADGRTWTTNEYIDAVPTGGDSKPNFECFNGVYYLAWQDGEKINDIHRSIFNIDVSPDGKTWERKYRFETEKSFQYATFHDYDGTIYLTVTQGDHSKSRKERIMFGRLDDVADASR